MANVVHDDESFLAKSLVEDSVISFTKLEEACEIAFQRLRCDLFKVLSQPTNSIYDALSDGWIDPLQFATGGFEDAESEHSYASFRRRTTFSRGSPRSPFATARF